jgi:gliding motility-associated-like protein
MINIIVHPAEDSTVIPNVITPNGDGFNDKLMLKNMIINDFSLEIFNRWGQKVFNTDDKFFSWDASFNSGSLSAGTYFYLAKYYSVCRNKKIDETGIITILR